MKAKFEFILPEEQEEFRTYKQAPQMYALLSEIENELFRRLRKYEPNTKDIEEVEELLINYNLQVPTSKELKDLIFCIAEMLEKRYYVMKEECGVEI